MERFLDNDRAYLDWVETHQQGYVVNAYREPSARYLVLHQADCPTITGEPTNGKAWTSDYIKVCSHDRTELEDWARDQVGGPLQPCSTCAPRSNRD